MDWKAGQMDGDNALLERLALLPPCRHWVEELRARRLSKRALMAPWKGLDGRQKRQAQNGNMADELSQRCGCEVLVSAPDPFKSKTTIAMLMDEGPLPLEEASPLVASLHEAAASRAQLLIAAPPRHAKRVEREARKILGL